MFLLSLPALLAPLLVLAVPELVPGAPPAWVGLPLALMLALICSLLAQAYWRRQARCLQRAERHWHLLADQLEQMVWFSRPGQSGLTLLSSAVERICGQAAGALQHQPQGWLDLVHPEDRERVRASWQLQPGATRRLEYRIRHRDGSWRWVRDRAADLRDATGVAIGRAGIVEDITRQREGERRLQQRQQQLRGMVEAARDAVITLDRRQRIVQFNRAAGEMLRIAPRRALGQRLGRFLATQAGAANPVDGLLAAEEEGAASRHMLQGLRADGEAFALEASVSRFGEGEQLLWTLVLRDLSEVQAMEAARRARELAEAANRAKTDFLSRMSHELRTPLNAVLGFAQLLRAGASCLDAEQQDQLAQIEMAGWHLAELIDDVLDVSRIEAGHLAVSLSPVSAQEALEAALQLSLPAMQQRGLQARAGFRAAPPLRLQADPVRLRQVLLNLLSNATKYNRPGGSLSLDLRAEGAQAVVEIADTGLGMSAQQLAHLFEPFNRLGREHSGIQGTGIGLVLSRQLMRLMQGELEVHSEPGQGTTVRLRLPLEAGSVAASTPAQPQPQSQSKVATSPLAGDGQPCGRVLCVEDNEVNMLLVEQLLAIWPAVQLLKAPDGATALRLAREHCPDLVLLDMHLPDMDGHQVLAGLRAEARTAGLPVVALSAEAGAGAEQAAREAGMLDYWTKPLDFAAFRRRMAALLSQPQPALVLALDAA